MLQKHNEEFAGYRMLETELTFLWWFFGTVVWKCTIVNRLRCGTRCCTDAGLFLQHASDENAITAHFRSVGVNMSGL